MIISQHFYLSLAIYKLLNTQILSYLFDKLMQSSLARNKLLILPRNKCELFNSFFYVKGVGCWNSLPSDVKSAKSCAIFKKSFFQGL